MRFANCSYLGTCHKVRKKVYYLYYLDQWAYFEKRQLELKEDGGCGNEGGKHESLTSVIKFCNFFCNSIASPTGTS